MKKILKLTAILLILAGSFSCGEEENNLPDNQAKGRIIEVLDGCYGEIVMIEIETPKGLGSQGSFSRDNSEIKYSNAVGVPYFSKTSIQEDKRIAQKTGTWIHFEFKEITEADDDLFSSNIVCPAIYGPPAINYYVITKIINYQNLEP
jgi:hypothetical protein